MTKKLFGGFSKESSASPKEKPSRAARSSRTEYVASKDLAKITREKINQDQMLVIDDCTFVNFSRLGKSSRYKTGANRKVET